MYKLEVELWAVRDGFRLCILLQIQSVENLKWKLISNLLLACSPIMIPQMLNQISQWTSNHCFKEVNSCADSFAKTDVHLQQDFLILDTPLVKLTLLLIYDLIGLGCKRICTETSSMAG